MLIRKASISAVSPGEIITLGDEQMQKDILTMANYIKKENLDEITSIYSTDINNNYIVYSGRITFKLGSTENLENKIYKALAATQQLNETKPKAEGEMTISDGKQVYFTEKR